ncbi:MAG: CBS domain-containing protein [Gammaproteobacteria bacterium]|nr:CBS domain-containing protein [Gammaproteobacteria bacterium]
MSKKGTGEVSILDMLAGTRTFNGVERTALKALIDNSKVHQINAGDVLFRPGDEYRNTIFIPYLGTMRLRRKTGMEDDVLPGEFIGLANYLDSATYVSTAIATTAARVLEIPADEFHLLERDHHSLFDALNRTIAKKLRERSRERGISSGILAQPVSSIMKSPVATCKKESSLLEAFQIMKQRKIGSLVITSDDGHMIGVITFPGLSEAVLEKGAGATDQILDNACQTAVALDPDTPIWEAEEIQRQTNARQMIIQERGQPIGIVSVTDILRRLISRPSALMTQIPQAASTKELHTLFRMTKETAADAQDEHHRPSAAVRYLSDTHLALQRRSIELTLEWMKAKGHGEPPCEFAVLIMGSGGRKEMMLDPDQDNGIIIQDSPEYKKESSKAWFDQFCKRMNKNLDRVGYFLCPGEIMARNPLYQKTISQWKKQISTIIQQPSEKGARWSNILFDFDTLYGNDELTSELRLHVFSEIKRNPKLLQMMMEHDAEGSPAIGMFNRLITTKTIAAKSKSKKNKTVEVIDIKRNGLRIIADAARIFALQNGVAVQNTTDRLTALVRIGKISNDMRESVSEAYEELLDMLLTHQIQQAENGEKLDKSINPEELTPQTRGSLRMAMRAVKRFQDSLQDEFSASLF